MALGGDNVEFGTALATYALNGTMPTDGESTVVLAEHGNKSVNLFELVKFLSEMTASADMKLHVMVKDNFAGVVKMSQGEHLWSSTNPDVMKLAVWVKTYVVPVMHQTHTESRLESELLLIARTRNAWRDHEVECLFFIMSSTLLLENEYSKAKTIACDEQMATCRAERLELESTSRKHRRGSTRPPEGTAQYATGSTPPGTVRAKHLLAEVASHRPTVVARSNEINEQVKAFDTKKFSDARIAKKMGEFARAQQKPDRAPNARERRAGVTTTGSSWEELPANLYRQALIDECIARGIALHGTTNYTTMTKKLKDWNKANGEDEKSILPRTAHFEAYFEG